MSRYITIVCNTCGATVREEDGIGWISTQRLGQDANIYGSNSLDGDFCSLPCLIKYHENSSVNKEAE